MLDSLRQDVRYALRNLRSSPGFATVAILSLALGIGANTAIFSLIDAVMLKFLPVSHPEELLQVTFEGNESNFTNPIWEELRGRQQTFSGVFAWGLARFNLNRGGEARYAPGVWASGEFFHTLGVPPALGRTLTATDDKRGCAATAVLGYDFWQKEYGGQRSVLGRSILLDGHPFAIIGVAAPGFSGLQVGSAADVIVPICSEPVIRGILSQLDERSSWWLNVVGRPKAGLDARRVTAALKTIAPDVFAATVPPGWPPESKRGYQRRTFETVPAGSGVSYVRAQYRQALLVLMGMVGVVLLIACANVANLLLARAASRQREIAIRIAIGAERARLIRQLLTESLLLSFAGAALGALFAKWGCGVLLGFLPSFGTRAFLDLTVDARVLSFTIGVALLTGLLFGIAPALRGTRVDPQAAMKTNSRGVVGGHSRFNLGKALVLLQVALSMVLLAGAGLMLGTFRKLATADAGFEPERVLLIRTDLRNAHYPEDRLPAAFEEMRQRIKDLPGVLSASFSDITPISGNSSNNIIEVEGFVAKSRRDSIAWTNRVSPGFFETFGTPLLAGRDFDQHDVAGAPLVAIANEALAKKFFRGTNPVGRYFRTNLFKPGPPIEIVGLVKDAKYRNLREDALPTFYTPHPQEKRSFPGTTFELRTGGPVENLIPTVRSALAAVNRDVTLEFRTLAVQVAESLNRERLLATLSGFFGALALLLATVGLYGVISYNVARRGNEIGIRMALGAARARVLRMILTEVVVLIGIGLAIGVATALASARLIASLLYGVAPTDPLTFSLAAIILAAVAALAGFLPAHRASRLDPMTALRDE
jgi:putative ABC transport system permease protein